MERQELLINALSEITKELSETFDILRESAEKFEGVSPKQYGVSLVKQLYRRQENRVKPNTYIRNTPRNHPYMRRVYSR